MWCQFVLLLLLTSTLVSDAFSVLPRLQQGRSFDFRLLMAAGMGMKRTNTRTKKTKGKKSTPFDASASLGRLEKRYEELTLADAKDTHGQEESRLLLSEYVIGVRASGTTKSVSDWIPVAQLCTSQCIDYVNEHEDSYRKVMGAAVSLYCRELSHAASLTVPVFKSIPRHEMEYSAEPIASFFKHVHDPIVDGGKEEQKKNGDIKPMTKEEARAILNLQDGKSDLADMKQSYRKLSFELHPDRMIGKSPQEVKHAKKQYHKVKLAYETLVVGGIRSEGASWYASLGGRARTDFIGPIPLHSRDLAMAYLQKQHSMEIAVATLDPEISTPFLLRNQLV